MSHLRPPALAGPSVLRTPSILRTHARRPLSARRASSSSSASGAPGAQSSGNKMTQQEADLYCLNLTKSTDHSAFLTSYFYPSLAKPGWFALNAFHAEIAQIRRKVSKEILGEMRYTWWRDAVKAIIAGDPPQHPVCLSLARTHQLHRLEPYHLNRLISAYAQPLNPAPSLAELRTFAHSTRSSLLLLAMGLLPPLPGQGTREAQKEEDRLGHALAHLGQGVGLAGILRGAGDGEGPLGRSWQGGEERWRERVEQVGRGVREDVARSREVLDDGKVGKEKLPVFLSAVPAMVYVDRLERAGWDPRVAGARGEDWRTSWRVWRAWRGGRF